MIYTAKLVVHSPYLYFFLHQRFRFQKLVYKIISEKRIWVHDILFYDIYFSYCTSYMTFSDE